MEKETLIQCIRIGYQDGIEDLENEENPNYEPTLNELPNDTIECQYAYEFGISMAREEMEIYDEDMNEYLEQILWDSNSELNLWDLT
jgi:hypothetical protein